MSYVQHSTWYERCMECMFAKPQSKKVRVDSIERPVSLSPHEGSPHVAIWLCLLFINVVQVNEKKKQKKTCYHVDPQRERQVKAFNSMIASPIQRCCWKIGCTSITIVSMLIQKESCIVHSKTQRSLEPLPFSKGRPGLNKLALFQKGLDKSVGMWWWWKSTSMMKRVLTSDSFSLSLSLLRTIKVRVFLWERAWFIRSRF
jgi:hypothetical protein